MRTSARRGLHFFRASCSPVRPELPELTDLFTGPSETWSFSPQLTVPVFDVGSTRAKLDVSKISRKIEIANYEKAIQTAFREVADALASRSILDEKLKAQELL